MTQLSGQSIDEGMLKLAQAQHNEREAAKYFEAAIKDGRAHQLLADLNTLDDILRELGIQESFDNPVEVVRALKPQSSEGAR